MPNIYTVDDAAGIARVSRRTIMRWLKVGILPDRRPNGVYRHIIWASDLEPWLGATAPEEEKESATV